MDIIKELSARRFSQSSYDENDSWAKEHFLKYITEKRGHTVINSEENMSHDIVTEKDGERYYFELEVKTSRYKFTNEKDFPFPTVSFLGRKKRLHNIQPFHYIIISKATGHAVHAESDIIYRDEYKEEAYINVSDREGDDVLYRVPKESCVFFKLVE
jgi:hypothetical protein